MHRIRRKHSPEFKAKVALEAIREQKTAAEISGQYAVHAMQVGKWKKQAIEGLPSVFSSDRDLFAREKEELVQKLYQQIGEQKVEIDWFKKKSGVFL